MPTVQRVHDLIATLSLQPHPEGGWYREVFRSAASVMPEDGRESRSALTAIYFLLEAGQHSRWHRVASDEVWVHLEGALLDLWSWDAANNASHWVALGPIGAQTNVDTRPQHVIPAGVWQAAVPQGHDPAGYTLVACMVGPGFDFADFTLMAPHGAEATTLRRDHPALAALI